MSTLKKWIENTITLHNNESEASEKRNGVTHLIGTILAFVFLIVVLIMKKGGSTQVGLLIYSATLILLYGSSTCYHLLPVSIAKRVFRLFDHVNIYLLIAGTYTPILLSITSSKRSFLLAVVWSIALIGTLFTLFFWEKYKALHIVLYLGMGWCILFFYNEVAPFISPSLMKFIIAGGVVYSAGIIFYTRKSEYSHAIWHLFCVVATMLFSIGFLLYL